MPEFSQKTLDHIKKPRNVGSISNADAIGESGDPRTGNYLKIWIKVAGSNACQAGGTPAIPGRNAVIEKITFKAYGCVPALAAGSAATEMAKGKTIQEALQIKADDIESALGGLPPDRKFCAKMAEEALKDAINKLA